jgi:hypothetical protein
MLRGAAFVCVFGLILMEMESNTCRIFNENCKEETRHVQNDNIKMDL